MHPINKVWSHFHPKHSLSQEDEIKRRNDARLVLEYFKKAEGQEAGTALTTYHNLNNWFLKKWDCLWITCVDMQEIER